MGIATHVATFLQRWELIDGNRRSDDCRREIIEPGEYLLEIIDSPYRDPNTGKVNGKWYVLHGTLIGAPILWWEIWDDGDYGFIWKNKGKFLWQIQIEPIFMGATFKVKIKQELMLIDSSKLYYPSEKVERDGSPKKTRYTLCKLSRGEYILKRVPSPFHDYGPFLVLVDSPHLGLSEARWRESFDPKLKGSGRYIEFERKS